MKVTGIICEYNPFHNGHILHIKQTKELTKPDVLVCIMSGNFVQRGEPAIIDKWERSKTAILNGVDLVVELPFIYATQSANYFAKGACDLLKLLKITDFCFGSESNDLKHLKALSKLNPSLNKDDGISNAKAYESNYGKLNANDILGINYLKHLAGVNVHSIKRTNNYHDSTLDDDISSATSIRTAIKEQKDYTKTTPMRLDDTFLMENYYPLIQTLLLTKSIKQLNEIFLMDEGIENLLVKNARNCDSLEAFILASTSKRYTASRIKRSLIHLINNTTKQEVNNLPKLNYLRVLAFNQKGKDYLNTIKEEVNIASKFNQIPSPYKEMELKANSVYCYPIKEHKKNYLAKELQAPIYLKKEGN